jgi:hypothetical protein
VVLLDDDQHATIVEDLGEAGFRLLMVSEKLMEDADLNPNKLQYTAAEVGAMLAVRGGASITIN